VFADVCTSSVQHFFSGSRSTIENYVENREKEKACRDLGRSGKAVKQEEQEERGERTEVG